LSSNSKFAFCGWCPKGQPRIAGSYVNRIENYPNLRVTTDRLKALADGLGVPLDELVARAVGITPLGEKDSDEFRQEN